MVTNMCPAVPRAPDAEQYRWRIAQDQTEAARAAADRAAAAQASKPRAATPPPPVNR